MKVYVFKDHTALSRYAAERVIEQVKQKPTSNLGLATGSTPMELYSMLVAATQAGEVSFKAVRTYNLDEYLGLGADHHQSYAYFMQKNLFDGIDILPENTHVPVGVDDISQAAVSYEALLRDSGGIDLQILGLGANGHIGFNEPGPELSNQTFKVTLDEVTRIDNARFFNHLDEVPREAITMGVGSIMRAEKILLMASGSGKADAIYKTVAGPITTQVPASLLQLHRDITVLLDEAAAAQLDPQFYTRR